MLDSDSRRMAVLIQGYLEDTLTREESAELLAALKSHPELASQLLDEIALNDLIRVTSRELDGLSKELKPARVKMQRISARMRLPQKKQPPVALGYAIAIASAAIIALMAVQFLIAPGKSEQNTASKNPNSLPNSNQVKELENAKSRLNEAQAKRKEKQEILSKLDQEQKRIALPQSNGDEQQNARLNALKELEIQRAKVERELSILREDRIHAQAELADLAEAVVTPPLPSNKKAIESSPKNALPPPEQIGQVLLVSQENNCIVHKPDGSQVALSTNQALYAGDRIITSKGKSAGNRPAVAVITFKIGATIELADDTVFEMTQSNTVSLLRGLLYADVTRDYDSEAGLNGSYKFIIKTPVASAGVLGTKFEISSQQESTRVRMEEGSLSLFNDHGRERVGALMETHANAGAKPQPPTPVTTLWRGRKGLAKAVEVAFQDGALPSPAYHNTEDAMIKKREPRETFGEQEIIEVDGGEDDNESGEKHALLRWRLTGIPKGGQLAKATITLNIANISDNRPFRAFELKREFVEKAATWESDGRKNWDIPGAQGRGDSGTIVIGTFRPSTIGAHVSELNDEGLSIIRKCIESPEKNFGILITRDPSNSDGFRFNSRQSIDPTKRPKLTVTFLVHD